MAKKKQPTEPAVTQPPVDGPGGDATDPVELVKIVREGNPSTADVHPDEVENYKAGGWSVAE